MDVYFGVLFNDGETYDGSSYLKIYLKPTVKVQETIYDYTVLSLLAEIGGYTGLFLGASVANLTIIIEKIKKYINWMEFQSFIFPKWHSYKIGTLVEM